MTWNGSPALLSQPAMSRARAAWLPIAASLVLAPLSGCSHEPTPDPNARTGDHGEPPDAAIPPALPAVGPTDGLPDALALALADTPHFEALHAPRPGEWLAEHPESGQTFREFLASAPNVPEPPRDTIYLLPIGSFEGDASPSLDVLEDYTRAYFGLEVQRLPAVAIDDLGVSSREHYGHHQLHAGEILGALEPRLPADAYCLIGLTMSDLYPEDDWNYVFGYASLHARVGVYGFARYDPAFFDQPRPAGVQTLILRRSMQVMSHEIGHMFGMKHCVHYSCNMNGSNSLEESDTQPSHLCPVCLRKLHMLTDLDVVARYTALDRFYRDHGLEDEARWVESRLSFIEAGLARTP